MGRVVVSGWQENTSNSIHPSALFLPDHPLVFLFLHTPPFEWSDSDREKEKEGERVLIVLLLVRIRWSNNIFQIGWNRVVPDQANEPSVLVERGIGNETSKLVSEFAEKFNSTVFTCRSLCRSNCRWKFREERGRIDRWSWARRERKKEGKKEKKKDWSVEKLCFEGKFLFSVFF